MAHYIHVLEGFTGNLMSLLMVVMELGGAIVIVYGAVRLFAEFFKLTLTESSTPLRLRLARTISMGLQFYLAGEIFRMVSVRQMDDLLIVGAIIILHVIISVLISWELGHCLHLAIEEDGHSIPLKVKTPKVKHATHSETINK